MKTVVTVLLLLVAAVPGCLPRFTVAPLGKPQLQPWPKADECPKCLELSGKYLKDILDIITSGGAVGTCAELCHLLEKVVQKKLVEELCFAVCSAAGIAAIVEFIKKSELDPFYFCDLIKLCPEKDDGDAHIISLDVKPNNVKQNSSFEVEMYFDTEHGTGVGQINLNITTAENKVVFTDNETVNALGHGEWVVTWFYRASPDWQPGNYSVAVAICYGKCWSHHPHSQVYDSSKANFTLSLAELSSTYLHGHWEQ